MPSVLFAPLVAAVVLAAAMGALVAQRWWQRRLLGSAIVATGMGTTGDTRLDILYFTGENCTVCHVAQRPALHRLRALLSDVAIREIDVAREPSAARGYRVMTLPTTVVLDAGGRTVAVNAGYASEVELLQQVEAARTSAMASAPA